MNHAKRWLPILGGSCSPSDPQTALAQGEPNKAKLKRLKPADYPTEPLEFVVVYPAGGGMDVTTRLLAKYVEK